MSATDPRVETLRLLRSIDASLKAIVAASLGNRSAEVTASDSDLDSPKGDEVVKFSPRDWTGESFKGSRMSQCPPEFLDIYAETCLYFARKNDENGEKTDRGTPKSTFDKRTAARARGWAARLRNGYTSTEPEPNQEPPGF